MIDKQILNKFWICQDTKEQNIHWLILFGTEDLNWFRDQMSLVAQMVKNLPAMQETLVWSLVWEDLPGEGNGNPLQYSCLKNSMDRRLQSIGSQSIRHDWMTNFHFFKDQKFSIRNQDGWLMFYWVGQKVSLGFSIGCYGKTRMNFWANPNTSAIYMVCKLGPILIWKWGIWIFWSPFQTLYFNMPWFNAACVKFALEIINLMW